MEGYGSLCSVRGSCLVSFFVPVVVFILLGPGAQPSSIVSPVFVLVLGFREEGVGPKG